MEGIDNKSKRWLSLYGKKTVLILLGVMAAVSTLKGMQNGLTHPVDFLHSKYVEAIFQHEYNDCQFPFTYWLMFLLGLFPEMPARVIWLLFNLGFTVIVIFTLRKLFFQEMNRDDFWILIFIMLSGGAWRTDLSNGQQSLAAIAFFLLSVYFYETGKKNLAGVFLSMSVFKYQLIVPMAVYYFYKRAYRVIAVAAGILLISLAATSVWFGGIYNVTMKQLLDSQGRGLGEAGDVDLESIFGLGDYIIPIFGIGVILLMILAYRLKMRNDLLFFCITMFSAWAFAYQRIYSFVLLIVPLGYAWMNVMRKKKKLYVAELIFCVGMIVFFFWSRTIIGSDNGIIFERLFFYPAFLMFCVDLWLTEKEARMSDVPDGA